MDLRIENIWIKNNVHTDLGFGKCLFPGNRNSKKMSKVQMTPVIVGLFL